MGLYQQVELTFNPEMVGNSTHCFWGVCAPGDGDCTKLGCGDSTQLWAWTLPTWWVRTVSNVGWGLCTTVFSVCTISDLLYITVGDDCFQHGGGFTQRVGKKCTHRVDVDCRQQVVRDSTQRLSVECTDRVGGECTQRVVGDRISRVCWDVTHREFGTVHFGGGG
jgi:hypothetical protein